MITELSRLIELPYSIMAGLVVGYIGYWCAYHGQTVEDTDKTFKVLVWALPTLLVLKTWFTVLSIIACFTITIALAFLWRKGLRKWLFKLLNSRKLGNLTNEDGYHSTIETIFSNTFDVEWLLVTLNDGKKFGACFMSSHEDLQHPKNITHTHIIDKEGNLAMYVDTINGKYVDVKTRPDTKKTLTYIPKETIAYIEIITK